ncbi:MAG: hypothetical protein ChlgKO_13070 [Chlamydiales bacterium]
MKEVLDDLAKETGLTVRAVKDQKGSFDVWINPDVKVRLDILEPGIQLSADIGNVPQEKKEELLMHLMEANFLGQGTGGNILGITKDEKKITLRFVKPFEVLKQVLHDDLESFVNHLLYWRKQTT